MIKRIAISIFFLLAIILHAEDSSKAFNVIVKDLVIAGKTVRISPFKGIGVITVNFCFKHAGEKQSPERKECLVALLSKAMGESTASKTREQLQAYSRKHNVHISFNSSDDNFIITGKCPSNKLSELFSLIEDVLFHSYFSDKDLSRLKNEMIGSTLQALQSPNTQLDELVKETILKKHPYGTLQKTYVDSLRNISSKDLKFYMKKHFTQENVIVSACGDIDEEQFSQQVYQVISALPKAFNISLPVDVKISSSNKRYARVFPVPQTVIRLLHEGISPHHPDFFALHIALVCLSNPGMGVLWKKVREEKGLTYDIRTNFSMQDHCNTFNIATFTQVESVEEMINSIKEVIVDIHEKGFSDELVDLAKKNFLGSYKRSFSSTANITTRLTNYQLYNRPTNFHNIVIEKILALTTDDVNVAFKKFFKPEQFIIFTVGQ